MISKSISPNRVHYASKNSNIFSN